MIPLGLAAGGPLADVLSEQTWFLIAGVAMAVMGIGALFVPAITCLDDTPQGVPFYSPFATVHPLFPTIRRKTIDPGPPIGYHCIVRLEL